MVTESPSDDVVERPRHVAGRLLMRHADPRVLAAPEKIGGRSTVRAARKTGVDPGRRQNIAGAGLGLTIAREIVQRAGGDIKISNREGGGLKQVVELAQVEEHAAVKDAAE